jgi:Ca2+-transporting ATPase
MSPKPNNWHAKELDEIFKEFQSNKNGLTDEEAGFRRQEYGFNELPKKKGLSKLTIVIAQFRSALVYILLVAAIVSFTLGEYIDAQIILAAILINVIVGFVQENKAQTALASLSKMVTLEIRVIRDGLEKIMESKYLVPGDVMVLEAGDKVAADARLFEAVELETAEASLTGESSPVNKKVESMPRGVALAERTSMVYSGTNVLKGRAKAMVVATGTGTEIGKIAKMLKEVDEEQTPLQKKLDRFSKSLGLFILGLSLFILVLGLLTGEPFGVMFNTAVAVAVAAIPEGLLVAVTVILALGMQSILKKKALVRKLVAAETLGSTTVICTDKTGTLTEGEMRVAEVVTDSCSLEMLAEGCQINKNTFAESYQLLNIGMICNDAIIQNEDEQMKDWQVLGSGTETALLLAAAQIGIKRKELEKRLPRLDEITFTSDRKYMATLHRQDHHKVIYFKGAPEILLKASGFVLQHDKEVKIYKDKRQEIIKKYELLSKKGLRVLALGYKKVPAEVSTLEENNDLLKDVVLVGFVGIKDPLRPGVIKTLKGTEAAGIKTVMITGDNKITARFIARELGMEINERNIIEGEELLTIDDNKLKERVREFKVYARVSPGDKLRIVQAWQQNGEVVAMTGDGVNDAPALKQADVGIALGSGSQVAKETADLVLLDNSYQTIMAAVEQGRVIYDNIKKVILYLLSDSFSEVILVIGSLMMGLPLPLLPAQILWINLITDGFPDMALTLESEESEVMNEPPQERHKSILDMERKLLIGIISGFTAFTSLGIFYYFWKIVGDLELARTVTFVALGIDSLLYVFSCRTLRHSIFHSHFFSNKYLLLAVGLGGILQVLAVYVPFFQNVLRTVPLGLEEWLIIAMVNVLVILLIELVKWHFIAKHKQGLRVEF